MEVAALEGAILCHLVWDNRCTMHRREPFAATERRILKRTQMFGDAPFLEL